MKPVIPAILLSFASLSSPAAEKPNIVLIITDDLGYGDLGCYGATKIPTPHLDQLAADGVRFTNGYAPSSTCTPTRYSILTGEYAWRKPPAKTGILNGDAPLAIDPAKPTLPGMLRNAGYATGLIGKWHLGLGDGSTPIDFNGEIKPGPLEIGFDSAFFIPATVDRVPCVFIENHRVHNLDPADPIKISYQGPIGDEPSGHSDPEGLVYRADKQHSDAIVHGISRIGYMTGGKAALWSEETLADTITSRAVAFIRAHKDGPFFLEFGTHDPHVPRWPHPRFRGKSGCGIRGDAVVEIDWCVGEIMKTLEETGIADNTLIIFTSDNGPVLFDGYFDGALTDQHGHQPAGGLRGWKYLVYEGACRVPLIARWPAKIQPRVENRLVNLVDLMATCASITGRKIPAGEAVDSMNLAPVLLNESPQAIRNHTVLHGISDALAIRKGDWKYVPANAKKKASGMGAGANPSDKRFVESKIPRPLLFNLAKDPAETTNVIADHPEKARELAELLQAIRKRN